MSGAQRVLITGGGGQLASDLAEQLGDRCDVAVRTRAELDVSDAQAVSRAFAELEPELVFNCAAFHNVEVCESEEEQSFEVNCIAVKHMAELCAGHEAQLVHLSTNYVFDGTRTKPYAEDDLPAPRSIYALSKFAGEHAALAYAPGALVARTAGLYGLHGSASKGGNFVTRMLARGREQGALQVVADQILSPTSTSDLAAALIEATDTGAAGLVHLTASGSCSWHEFTEAIMAIAGLQIEVAPARTQRAPGRADRPLNGVLARSRADALELTPLRPWRTALEDYMVRAGLAGAAASAV